MRQDARSCRLVTPPSLLASQHPARERAPRARTHARPGLASRRPAPRTSAVRRCLAHARARAVARRSRRGSPFWSRGPHSEPSLAAQNGSRSARADRAGEADRASRGAAPRGPAAAVSEVEKTARPHVRFGQSRGSVLGVASGPPFSRSSPSSSLSPPRPPSLRLSCSRRPPSSTTRASRTPSPSSTSHSPPVMKTDNHRRRAWSPLLAFDTRTASPARPRTRQANLGTTNLTLSLPATSHPTPSPESLTRRPDDETR